MMERSAWPLMLVMVLVLAWVGPLPCAAQSQSQPVAAPSQPAQSAPTRSDAGRVAIPPPRLFSQPGGSTTTAAPTSRVAVAPPRRVLLATSGSSLTTPMQPGTTQPPVGVAPLPGESPAPSTAALAPVQGELALRLKPPPLEPTDLRFPINLATALRLSDARPLIVAAAQASVWVAEAQLTRAKVLWVPTLMVGADYIRHDGGGPDFNKGIMTAPSVNFFYGGAGADQYVNLTDAIFQPLIARQVLSAKQWDIQTAKNDVLLQTAEAYFNVHQYRGSFAGALYCVERGHDLVERIAQLSRELVPVDEVDRARNMVADLEQQATMARQEWRVNSANLTQVLRLDPRAVVEPLEHDHLQVTLIDPAVPLEDLQRIALTNRPELASYRAMVQATEQQIRREKWRPALPIVMLNGFQSAGMWLQAGLFGLGPNSAMNQWVGRVDVSLQFIWQFDAFGIGNLARIKEQRGNQSAEIIELFRTQDNVAAEVLRAMARLQSATARVSQADRALRTAIITFNGNFEGLRHTTRFGDVLVLVNRPQEAVYALELLKLAFDEYFTTVAEYNKAQFQLFHALGYPARELAILHPPGDIIPVDLARPAALPVVGNGPPPATR